MDLADFGKQAILWGAGLSKNFGGFLADEFWGHLVGRPEIERFPRIRELLQQETNFEQALDAVEIGDFSDDERRALWDAVVEVFALQDEHLLDRSRDNEGAFLRFLAAFKPKSPAASSGYLFTLNQDVLLEAMGSHRPGNAEPRCPAVFPSQGAFTLQFRSPFLLEHDKRPRPVPDGEPPGGWPSLRDGLHYVKLHGSASWKTSAGRHNLVIGGGKTGLIDRSPLLSWYRDIFRAVCTHGGVKLLIVGYGFRDAHINDILALGVQRHDLTTYVVGNSSNKAFRDRIDPRLLPGIRGYVNTPLAQIIGDGVGDTPAMAEIKRFLGR